VRDRGRDYEVATESLSATDGCDWSTEVSDIRQYQSMQRLVRSCFLSPTINRSAQTAAGRVDSVELRSADCKDFIFANFFFSRLEQMHHLPNTHWQKFAMSNRIKKMYRWKGRVH